MPSTKPVANKEFLKRVREYLPMDAVIQELDANGQSDGAARDLADNSFYAMDAESMVALSHAIEDIALDAATGSLISSFQDSKNFESQRDRYWQIAATIEEVRVVTAQKKPRRQGCLNRFDLLKPSLMPYWFVIYQGRRLQVMVLSRQSNKTHVIPDKKFVGFYTFEPAIIELVKGQILKALQSKESAGIPEFDRLFRIDLVARQIQNAFIQAQITVENAVAQCQIQDNQSTLSQFTSQAHKALEHIRQTIDDLSKT